MNKTRNVAPTNMDSLFDAAPYEKTPLSKLPIDMQAEIICGCGFYGLQAADADNSCLLYTSPSPRDGLLSRMPSSA